jgi:transcriptional regulator GlxA family with amidase domain
MAAAWRPEGSEHAAAALEEALQLWSHPPDCDRRRERLTTRRHRQTVAESCRWMDDHLCRRFSLAELGLAMGISVRTLQYGFREQLGRSPMAELKRRRLRRLRQLLQEPDHDNRSVAELMQAAGLLACGATAADYGRCWGESPRRTRQRRTMDL